MIRLSQHAKPKDRAMNKNNAASTAKATELSADQLDLVHGGIIIVGGLVARSSIGTLTFSGLTNIARSLWS
jgi:hypothetical protein